MRKAKNSSNYFAVTPSAQDDDDDADNDDGRTFIFPWDSGVASFYKGPGPEGDENFSELPVKRERGKNKANIR